MGGINLGLNVSKALLSEFRFIEHFGKSSLGICSDGVDRQSYPTNSVGEELEGRLGVGI